MSSKSILTIIAGCEFCLLLLIGIYYFNFYHPKRPVTNTIAKEIISSPMPTAASATIVPSLAPPTATPTVSDTRNYKDYDYGFKISFPASWSGILNQKTNMGLETYTIHSPDKSESLEILVSQGIWADVKLELGHRSKATTFLGSPCLVSKNGKSTVYVFASKTNGQIFRITIDGDSTQINKIFKSFKFL